MLVCCYLLISLSDFGTGFRELFEKNSSVFNIFGENIGRMAFLLFLVEVMSETIEA